MPRATKKKLCLMFVAHCIRSDDSERKRLALLEILESRVHPKAHAYISNKRLRVSQDKFVVSNGRLTTAAIDTATTEFLKENKLNARFFARHGYTLWLSIGYITDFLTTSIDLPNMLGTKREITIYPGDGSAS